ncbi:MAG: hypothetical protein WBL23_06705 [Salinisphaera sp.]|uniref:hypothetical protein n=1 Tax=Salinisphaera sp. TaxID=1914330 RepID=UPI003C7B26E9
MPLARQTSPKIARVVALTALAGANVSDKPAGKRVCAGRAGRNRGIDDGAIRRVKAGGNAHDVPETVISDNPGSG